MRRWIGFGRRWKAACIAAAGLETDLAGLNVLGWYHSHIYSKIFLSERDLQIHFPFHSR